MTGIPMVRCSTSTHRGASRRPGWRLGSAAVLLMTAAACSPATSPDDSSATTPPGPRGGSAADTQRAAALELCARFTITALSVDTATDTSPADARTRAVRQFGTDAFAQALTGQGHDTAWTQLVAHHGRVLVSTAAVTDDPPTTDGILIGTAVIATRTATADDGWQHHLPPVVAYCALTSTAAGWQVTDISFTDSVEPGAAPVTTVPR